MTARHPSRVLLALGAGALATALAACGGGGDDAPAATAPTPGPTATPLAACMALNGTTVAAADLSLPTRGALITSAALVLANDPGNTNGEYCRVLGAIKPMDATAPDIRFQVNLPSTWNGKALQFGGGGYNGSIPSTIGKAPLGSDTAPVPLAQGYMTLASDSGHQAADADDASFALNDEALLNYGYMHIKKTRDVAVALANTRYGSAPKRMYYAGGSTGGREALTAALRFPEAYDGVISNYPTANFLGLRLWGAALARAVYDNSSAGWIPPAMVAAIADRALQRCDALDGVADGLVSNMPGCRAISAQLVSDLSCKAGETGNPTTCLTPVQISKTLSVYHDGYTLPYAFANNVTRYLGYNSLEGITMQLGSQAAYIEPPVSGPNAHHVSRADQFVKYFVARNPTFNLLTLDIQNPGIYQNRIVELSDTIGATSSDYTKFKDRGGKVLWVQGQDDPSVSPYANAELYSAVVTRYGQAAADTFMRFYLIPGLAHGNGKFLLAWDNLAILDDWVEGRQSPPATPVGFDSNTATKGRSRPVCVYPTWPKYNGAGDVNAAASYTCVRS
ncbi:tannase/feruloyl esterase family alpha/beta hydrolase [Pigmentiphaga litoralis]|uniref:tannase/feruloyl esterase family alpha/beta hydrolase n=1 Tax=Pigmentiphaga litoralis TaxID=516702 RepID=UPI003B4327B0